MRTEYKLFGIVAAFLFGACAVYAWWSAQPASYNQATGTPVDWVGTIDWAGTIALLLSGLLCLMLAGYFWFVSRRIDLRPEDRPDAEISEGAGEVGFFSPGSYWPFGIALSAATAAIGLAFLQWWVVAAGVVAVTVASSAMLFEYYTGTRRTVEH